jgi:AmmeMemoRadiSam system protein B
MLRKAIFAGSFYDASPNALKQQFDNWFEKAELPQTDGRPLGVICPHAGYIYSGSCAAYSYKLLKDSGFKKAILIHPSHRGNHFGYSVSPYDEYATPLGNLPLDKELAEKLMAGSEEIDDWYHQNEHSMEVQLPLLSYIKPEIKIVPVMLGNQSRQVSQKLADILVNILQEDKETAIIVSTDLSHYHNSREAETLDNELIDKLEQDDTDAFYQEIVSRQIEACGFAGVLMLMYLSQKIYGSYIQKLKYTHSGYSSGDFEQVVGYLSAALLHKDK